MTSFKVWRIGEAVEGKIMGRERGTERKRERERQGQGRLRGVYDQREGRLPP